MSVTVTECLQRRKRSEMARHGRGQDGQFPQNEETEWGTAREAWDNQEIGVVIETQEQRQKRKPEPEFVDTGHYPTDNLTGGQLSLEQPRPL